MSWFIFAKVVLSLVLASFAGVYAVKACGNKVEEGFYGEALVGVAALVSMIFTIWI